MTTIDCAPVKSAQALSCEICDVRDRILSINAECGVQAVAELEQRAQLGAQWQLCVVCQVVVSLWESGEDQDCPRA